MFGIGFDAINAVWYLAETEWVNGGLSFAAVFFEGASFLRYAKYGDEMAGATGAVARNGDEIAEGAAHSGDEFVDLASPARREHILDGDLTGGGHLWPGASGKTPFPASWSSDRIMHEVSDIATDPQAWRAATSSGPNTVLHGVRDGVEIRVVVNTSSGAIITGYPVNLTRNNP